ncbi:MAG TPA: CDP-alcohol phosphatidyltransferase family protein [Verrucomicrobiaceae bacterium]
MTTATYITLARILLIPVFVGFAIYYARSLREHQPDENLRLAAVITFAVAALSDLVDGWVARHFNQRSRLGAILDPLADKLLLVAAVITLAFSEWPVRLPLWFVIIVITRELLSIAGAFLIDHVAGKVSIHPHWTGKAATAFLITTAGCAMVGWDRLVIWLAAIGCAFTFTSGAIYIAESVRQMNDSEKEHGKS